MTIRAFDKIDLLEREVGGLFQNTGGSLMISRTQVQDKFITLNGLKFHYREWEKAEAPTLVLLHGVTGHARMWDTTAQAMQSRYRVLALDQRGHGETEWAKDNSWLARRDDIGAFARILGLRKFFLLGHSMGGVVAYRFAGAYPDMVERLVIVSAGPPIPNPPASSGSSIDARKPLPVSQLQYEFDTKEEMVKYMSSGLPHASATGVRTYVLSYACQLDNGHWTMGYDPLVLKGDPTLTTPDELWALVSKITCPTLVVRGAEDTRFSREQAERMAREIPNCRLVEIPGAGHTVPWDRPTEFIIAVREFLAA
jgi:pimeloyl-ACP methyl ester carboxylesterase